MLALPAIAQQAAFEKVRLIDVQPYVEAQAPFIATNASCPGGCPVAVTHNKQAFVLTVGQGAMSYAASFYETKHFHSADFVVGDEIDVSISNGEMAVIDSEGKIHKAKITRRAKWEHT